MREVLDRHFVCIDYDPNEQGPFPVDDYPGLQLIQEGWDENPWTRVSFGQQWVVEPEGQYPLAFFCRGFDTTVEKALRRLIRIRSHPRGSDAERGAIDEVLAELELDRQRLDNGPSQRTRAIFTKAEGNLPERFPGVFEFDEPWVRARAAELLGEYARDEGDEGFRPGGPWEAFGQAVSELLSDEEPSVRSAAAVAMHRFFDRTPQGATEAATVEAAAQLWREAGGL